MKTKVYAALVSLSTFAFALTATAAEDVTSKLVLLSNPAKSKWPSSSQSRHVQDLHPYKGKIYTSGGEWGNNTGPCPCFAVDPYTGSYTNEFSAGTDAIYEFKTFSDGRLYCSAIDPHEGATYCGHTFRRDLNGVWSKYSNCYNGKFTDSSDATYYTHNWDMAEYKGKTFVCGYGISGSSDSCTSKMFDASPDCTKIYRVYSPGYTWKSGQYTFMYSEKWDYRRFCAFLPFDDDLFCIPTQLVHFNEIKKWDWEEWRWDESLNKFVCQTNTWDNIAPGVTDAMSKITMASDSENERTQLWHPTKFKNRVLYIYGGHNYNITPWCAFSAINDNHKIKATRINLGSDDVLPFDFYATSDAIYLAAAQASKTTTTVTNSIWKSTDGVNFTKLMYFTSTRQASALCYYDGSFYVGMGSNTDTGKVWPKMTGTDVSGNIYRIPYDTAANGFECDNTKLAITEGCSGTVKFRLKSKPSANVTAQISTSGQVSVSVKSLTFTTSNWSSWQSVSFDVAQDDLITVQNGGVICGGVEDITTASCIINVVNDDFAEKETKPNGLVDLTTTNGTFYTDVKSNLIVKMNPFNNAGNDADHRVCVQTKNFSITYEFPSNAMVNAYVIKMYSDATRAPYEWKLYASNDTNSWTEIDHRNWEISWKAGEIRYHTCANTQYYKYYKFQFLNNNGAAYTQFGYIELYGEFAKNAPAKEDRPQVSTSGTGLKINSAKGTLDLTISNAKSGFYYTAFVTDDLTKPFVASAICVQANADGSLELPVPTSDKSSYFVKIVVTSMAVTEGVEL